jgi:hypothetical protein
MLHDKQLITVDSTLWQAIGERAERDRMTTEDWLRRQLHASVADADQTPTDDADEVLFDLVVRHVRDLGLNRDEQLSVADAIASTVESGEPSRVGPIGARRRHYRIHRRASAVCIRVGEGQVSLPLAQAMQLFGLLSGADHLPLETVIAA